MAVEYDISSDVAVIKETGSVSQCARVTQMYSGQITYDDEAGSKFATATINGKSQRVMLCIAVSGTVTYDDVPSLYSTVDGHRCLNIVTPTETGTPDDVPSLYETVVIDGQNVRAVRCIMINKTPVYDGVSSTCTFTGDDGKTHTAQLVNKITGGSVEVIIKGTSPLNLPDAIANSLSYVKAFGGTEQNGTPTPDTPVDIVSNNGVLKARHQSGLPLGYKLVDYIKSNAMIELDKPTNDTMEFVAKLYREGTNAQYAYQSDTSSSGTTNTTAYISSGGNWRFGRRTASIDLGTGVMITSVQNAIGVWLNGEQVGTYEDVTAFTSTNNLRLFGTQSTPQLRLYGLKVYQNGAPFYDLVPCQRESDSAYGVYDLVSGQFFTNTDATITAGSFVSDPVEIYTDGTVETINVHGKNLFNKNTVDQNFVNGKIKNNSGAEINDSTSSYSTTFIKVLPSTPYTFSWVGGYAAIQRVYYYTNDKQWISRTNVFGNSPVSFTTPNNCAYIQIQKATVAYNDSTNFQLELGSTATEYTPYYDGGTATAEMLLKVGDYQDEQEILSGAVTRNVGVKVFDGTENWTYTSSRFRLEISDYLVGSSIMATIISHYKLPAIASGSIAVGEARFSKASATDTVSDKNTLLIHDNNHTSLNSYKTWLADQYAAGTPVIVIYPLATPTTESVAGQTLQVADGDNTLKITQASLTGLELEAQYQAAVSLTIQEVEDANLDNNVEVTIS